jgi:hypothetical protein
MTWEWNVQVHVNVDVEVETYGTVGVEAYDCSV